MSRSGRNGSRPTRTSSTRRACSAQSGPTPRRRRRSNPVLSDFATRRDRALTPVEDGINLLAAVATFLLMALGVAQIVMRPVFNAPLTGYVDLVELSMASMAFLGTACCQRLGAHIRMELLVGYLKGRALWGVEIFGTLVATGIIGTLVWCGWKHFLRSYTLGDTTIDAEFPVWPPKLLAPIAFAIWWLRLAVQPAGSTRLLRDPSLVPVEVVTVKDAVHQARDEITEVMGDAAPKDGAS